MKPCAALLLVWTFASPASADLAPPPGKKWIPVRQVVEADVEPVGYTLFLVWSSAPFDRGRRSGPVDPPGTRDKRPKPPEPPPDPHESTHVQIVRLTHGTSVQVVGELYAIPDADLARHPTPRAAVLAVLGGNSGGAHRLRNYGVEEVDDADPRTEIVVRLRIDAITPERGFATTVLADPPGGFVRRWWPWIAAGSAATLALVLGGVWLVLRRRKG
jgi:hypothetical protein